MKKILIVDDDMSTRLLLIDIIMIKDGFEISEASSVREAISLSTRIKYDLIFLDHSLKDGIGWELAEMICRNLQKYGRPKIVTMSGSVLPAKDDEKQKYYSQFIPKPFEIDQVFKVLEKCNNPGNLADYLVDF
jgi:DNA-binding NtrC family response regulator